MDDKEVLQRAAGYFKQYYPGIKPESVICFLVIADMGDGASLPDVAQTVGMTDAQCFQFLAQLNVGGGVGLVQLLKGDDGAVHVYLTGPGNQAVQAVQQAIK